MAEPFTLIADGQAHRVDAVIEGEWVSLSPESVRHLLGWTLEPQGLCRGDVCRLVRDRAQLVRSTGIDLGALAATLDRPLALDVDERSACLGASAAERGDSLQSLEAPDFTLADLAGTRHSLSDYRGRKVLLLAYASW